MWVQWGQPKEQDPHTRRAFHTFFCPWLFFVSKFISHKGRGGHGVCTRVLMSKGLPAGVGGKSRLCSWTGQGLSIPPFPRLSILFHLITFLHTSIHCTPSMWLALGTGVYKRRSQPSRGESLSTGHRG